MFKNFQQIETFFENRKSLGIKPGLDRINKLLLLLDNPQNKINAIHVAGTNGKGSTINYIKDALMFNGFRIGVFTSPSIEGLTGHIFIDDSPISEKLFIKLLNEMYPAIQELDSCDNHPTEFEIITALAFVSFAKHVDFALIETGMGGRGDTTNCFIPLLSIITNVARDHIAFLGDTLKEIAYHKAGIIKENIPVVIGGMKNDALTVIEREASIKHTNVKQFALDFDYTIIDQSPLGQKLVWHDNEHHQIELAIRMRGEHQLKNAAVAVMALMQLEKIGIALDWEKAVNGIGQSQVPGRFEVVNTNPTVIVDGAHNEAGIHSFIQTVINDYSDKERHLIFAGFKDKELDKMLEQLSSHFTSITVTTFDHPRAAKSEELYQMLQMENKVLSSNWEESIDRIKNYHSNDQLFFVTGSLHFISKVRKRFVK